MLGPLMDKVDTMQEQMGNISKEIKILRKIQNECCGAKTVEQKWRISWVGLLVDWMWLGKTVWVWEYLNRYLQRKANIFKKWLKKVEKRTDWVLWDNYKILICAYLKYQREKKKKVTRNIWNIMTENFFQINVRHHAIIQEAQRIPYMMNGKKNNT